MKVPINWLNEFLSFSKPVDELEKILTMRGLEVESIDETEMGEVINIELTPNRGDCASIIGVAREIAAYYNSSCKIPEGMYTEKGTPVSSQYKLEVDIPEKCPVYYLKYIKNVVITESPGWIKERLIACGIRPLNNVIDITNYVLLETGQPLHAFDASRISGDTVFVRNGTGSEEILSLDGSVRRLTSDDIVIADEKNPIAIGGVMGGENSSVTANTKDILLECAFFVPDSIARTERRLELKTESSYRFARHVDVNGMKSALDRATCLIEDICKGQPITGELMKKSENTDKKRVINLDLNKLNRILGTEITIESAETSLTSLGCDIEIKGDIIAVTVPSYRNDITRPIDLVEEVARMYGYDNIEPSLPDSKIITSLLKVPDYFSSVNEVLKSEGYWESITHTLISGEIFNKACQTDFIQPVEIDNPINVNMNILRPNLLFGLLDVSKYNINQKQAPVKFFERGPVFYKEGDKYNEKLQVAFISESGGYFAAKSMITSILRALNQDFSLEYEKKTPFFESSRNGAILINGKNIGQFGCISKSFLKLYKVSNLDFIGGYIMLDSFDKKAIIDRKFTKWSAFPSVFRDLSLVVPVNLTHSQIIDKIENRGGEILRNIQLYDVYKDDKLGHDKKSMTYTLEFNSMERTLTATEVDSIIEEILGVLDSEHNITLRPQ